MSSAMAASFVGCQTGILRSRANCLTAGGASLLPRPFGVSGLVMTAAIVNFASYSALRAMRLCSSVPKKIIGGMANPINQSCF